MNKRYDSEKLEREIYEQIEKSNTTCGLMAQALKLSKNFVQKKLNQMLSEGKIMRRVVGCVAYYSRGYFPAHDPFNLTGRTYEYYRQSDATHS